MEGPAGYKKNNRVFIIDEYDSFFSDPISLDKQLEFIVNSLLERENNMFS